MSRGVFSRIPIPEGNLEPSALPEAVPKDPVVISRGGRGAGRDTGFPEFSGPFAGIVRPDPLPCGAKPEAAHGAASLWRPELSHWEVVFLV